MAAPLICPPQSVPVLDGQNRASTPWYLLFNNLVAQVRSLLASLANKVVGPSVAIANDIPQFADATGKLLKDGLGLVSVLGDPGLDSNVPSEKAVRSALSGRCVKVTLTGQASAISPTDLLVDGAMAPEGTYCISGYFVCSVAGTGSAVISIAWNDGVAAQTFVSFGGALISLGAYAQNRVFIRTDGAHQVTYSATYTGAGGAAYDFYLVMEPLT